MAPHRLLPGFLLSLLLFFGCSGEAPERHPLRSQTSTGYSFEYPAIDGSRLSSDTTRGRRTVLVFMTTYDLVSQVVVRTVMQAFRVETPRINAGLVVLEPPKNLPLVEAFAASLDVPFPVALADAETLGGRGPFGNIVAVPTTLVLDVRGALLWRKEGGVTSEELREGLGRGTR